MGASPFHSGHSGGPMSGPMGGMGHMGPSMGGPTMGGQSHGSSSSMFRTSVSLGCVRHNIVCPKWCLAVDSNGCKSCPCGPGRINMPQSNFFTFRRSFFHSRHRNDNKDKDFISI
jgi:hypothetical protein